MSRPVPDVPIAELNAGRVRALKALRLHNGTIYRWNRACFGVTDGVPHLRIENRVLPSGAEVDGDADQEQGREEQTRERDGPGWAPRHEGPTARRIGCVTNDDRFAHRSALG